LYTKKSAYYCIRFLNSPIIVAKPRENVNSRLDTKKIILHQLGAALVSKLVLRERLEQTNRRIYDESNAHFYLECRPKSRLADVDRGGRL
jgi:hypothetical protein